MFIGRFDQFDNEIETVKINKEIVVDLTGLLTLQILILLNKLNVAFSRLLISQSVYETLKKWQKSFDEPVSLTTIWEDSGRSLHKQLSEQEIENRRCFINEIVAFVEEHFEVLPATRVLSIPNEKLDEYQKAFGERVLLQYCLRMSIKYLFILMIINLGRLVKLSAGRLVKFLFKVFY